MRLSMMFSTRAAITRVTSAHRSIMKEIMRQLSSSTDYRGYVINSKFQPLNIPAYSNMSELLVSYCEKHGKRKAFTDGSTGKTLTFNDVRDLMVKYGSGLKSDGFTRGDVLAVVAPTEIEYTPIMLAVTALGGTLTAYNPQLTSKELEYHLNISDPSFVIGHPTCNEKLGEAMKQCANKQKIKKWYTFGEYHGWKPLTELENNNGENFDIVSVDVLKETALLPFSSGTTGFPKGVMLTHHNLIANMFQYTDPSLLYVEADESRLFVMPNSHIYGAVNSLITCKSGSQVVQFQKFEAESFLAAIQTYKLQFAYTVPPLVLFLAKHPLVANYDLSSMSRIVCGAAPLGKELTEALFRTLPDVQILQQAWGMTELSPVGLSDNKTSTKMGSVGGVVPNTEALVVDTQTQEPLPANSKGEIWIRGPQVMKGYIGNTEVTHQTVDANGWCHSGDIGHYDDDNDFYVYDRLKELIKYKGFQVAPAELESVIAAHPGVADVAVVGVPDEYAGELPKAFVVAKTKTVEPADIIKFVERNVAQYKNLRGGVEFVDEIPKSPSGKILRRLLKV